jgi:sugar lactone lactonase YvrE
MVPTICGLPQKEGFISPTLTISVTTGSEKSLTWRKQNVYFLPKGKKVPILVDDNLKQPNGIVGTPDGKYLYVADIRDSKTYKYEINRDGSLSNRQLFVAQGFRWNHAGQPR